MAALCVHSCQLALHMCLLDTFIFANDSLFKMQISIINVE